MHVIAYTRMYTCAQMRAILINTKLIGLPGVESLEEPVYRSSSQMNAS